MNLASHLHLSNRLRLVSQHNDNARITMILQTNIFLIFIVLLAIESMSLAETHDFLLQLPPLLLVVQTRIVAPFEAKIFFNTLHKLRGSLRGRDF